MVRLWSMFHVLDYEILRQFSADEFLYGRKICIFGVSRPMAIFREIYVENNMKSCEGKCWEVAHF